MQSQYSLHPPPHPSTSKIHSNSRHSHRSSSSSQASADFDSTHPSEPNRSSFDRRKGNDNDRSDFIGRPIFFSTGPFEGKVIRMELHEIQKADLGRKYAKVDRRPLDPPPVVQLKIFEVHNADTNQEYEQELEYDEVQALGLLCTVDLFPVPGIDPAPGDLTYRTPPSMRSTLPPDSPSSSSCSSAAADRLRDATYASTQQQTAAPPHIASSSSRFRHSQTHYSGYILPPENSSDVVHRLNGFPITENSKQTQALVGATFVQPVVMEYQGSKAIIFVFADLAVKIEGFFILRYRAFDIFARNENNNQVVSAECYGRTFRVYSTKEFPGLSASTELTKILSLWGVRLNIRVTERRRRKRPVSGRRSPTPDDDYDDELVQ